MNALDILSTSPATSVGNEKGQRMRIEIVILGFNELKLTKLRVTLFPATTFLQINGALIRRWCRLATQD